MDQDFAKNKNQVLSELHYFFGQRKEATFKLDRYRKRYWNSWNRVPGFRDRCNDTLRNSHYAVSLGFYQI